MSRIAALKLELDKCISFDFSIFISVHHKLNWTKASISFGFSIFIILYPISFV
jgi:hypothetical protein